MHSPHYLASGDFTAYTAAGESADAERFTDGRADARVAIIAPDPVGDLQRCAGPVLLWTHRFYERLRAHTPDYFDYPSHYVIGGMPYAEPRLLGAGERVPWSDAWCRLDVWPAIRHGIAAPEPATMLAAALSVEPTHLLWPARWRWPRDVDIDPGPGDRAARGLLRARLHAASVYGDEAAVQPGAWRLAWTGGAARLTEEARARLPDAPPKAAHEVCLASIAVDEFLGAA